MTIFKESNKEKGLTLVELLMAAVILIIVLVGTFAAIMNSANHSLTTRRLVLANTLAQKRLEQLKNVAFESLLSYNHGPRAVNQVWNNDPFLTADPVVRTMTLATTVTPLDPNRRLAKVSVYGRDNPPPGEAPLITASTILTLVEGSQAPCQVWGYVRIDRSIVSDADTYVVPGNPIANVSVTAKDMFDNVFSAVSGSDGKYVISNIPYPAGSDKRVDMSATPPPPPPRYYGFSALDAVTLISGSVVQYDIDLVPYGRIRGRVLSSTTGLPPVNPSGNPVQARVWRSGAWVWSALGTGYFEFQDVPLSNQSVSATDIPYHWNSPTYTITPSAGKYVNQDIYVTPYPAMGTISGRVYRKDKDGNVVGPTIGAWVRSWGLNSSGFQDWVWEPGGTDSPNGDFNFGNVFPGNPRRIYAGYSGTYPDGKQYNDRWVDVNLPSGGTISGIIIYLTEYVPPPPSPPSPPPPTYTTGNLKVSVRNSNTGNLINDRQVTIIVRQGSENGPEVGNRTVNDGSFTWNDLTPDTYYVTATAAYGYNNPSPQWQSVSVPAGPPSSPTSKTISLSPIPGGV